MWDYEIIYRIPLGIRMGLIPASKKMPPGRQRRSSAWKFFTV